MNKKALVISIQRDRYELLSENEKLFGRLKKSVFYNKNRMQVKTQAVKGHKRIAIL